MSSFFMSTVKARLEKDKNRYELLKLNDLLSWDSIGNLLRHDRAKRRKDSRGNGGFDPLKMFKAVLLGQWHNLSDPALEHAIAIRADFLVFCDFDDMELPDHSTRCRFRDYLEESGLLSPLLREINDQLGALNLKVEKASTAVVDASIIESAAKPLRKSVEVDGNEVTPSQPSKDPDARWTKKAKRFHLGYKLHACVDGEGYFDNIEVTAANAHEVNHLESVLEHIAKGTEVLADKGYSSQANRKMLSGRGLRSGLMHKAVRGKPLTQKQIGENKRIQKQRYVVEQSFGTLKRKFGFHRARYFGQSRVLAQSYLKAMCLNLVKALNKVSYT